MNPFSGDHMNGDPVTEEDREKGVRLLAEPVKPGDCLSKCPEGLLAHPENRVIYRGGCHHVACLGDGTHYWFWNDMTGIVRESKPCDAWLGGCPTGRTPFKPSTLEDLARYYKG